MSRSITIGIVLTGAIFVWVVAHASQPAGLPKEEDQIREYLAQAKDYSENNRNELAASKLRIAQALMREVKVSSRVAKEIKDLLKKVDPHQAARRRDFEKAAKDIVRVARKYEGSGWDDTALEIVELAMLLDPDEVAPMRKSLLKKAQKAGLDRANFGGDMFRDFRRLFGTGEWMSRLDQIISPPLEEGVIETQCILSDQKLRGHLEMRFEINVDREAAKVGMIVGYQSTDLPCYLIELNQESQERYLRVFEYTSGGLNSIRTTGEAALPKDLPDWIPMLIRWDDEKLTVQCLDMKFSNARGNRVFEGYFGPFISGDSPKRSPVKMRGLTITPLD